MTPTGQGRDADSRQDAIVRNVARGGSLNLAGSLITAVLIFLQAIIVSRGVSTTVAGVYFSVTSAAVILTTAAVFGAGASLPRFIPLLRVHGRPQGAAATIRMAAAISMALSIALALVLLLLRSPAADFLSLDAVADQERLILGLLVVCLPLSALAVVWVAATRAMLNIWPTVVLEKVGKAVLQVVGLAAAIALGSGAAGLLSAWLLPTALLAIPAYFWLRRIVSRQPRVGREVPEESTAGLLGEYLSYSWPRAVQSVLQVLLQRLDVILLAALATPTEAAIYALATRFILLGQFAASSLSQVVAPHFSGLFAEDRHESAMQLAKTVTTWTVLLVWPIFLLSMADGSGLLEILGGPEYSSGATALAILAGGMLFASMTGPVDTILLMAGRSSLSLSISAVAVALDVGLIFALVPSMGINGAAVAWSLALVLRSGVTLALVHRIAGYSTLSRSLGLVAAIAVASFLVVPLTLARLLPAGVGYTWAGVLAGCVVYLALILTFRHKVHVANLATFLRKR